jgi:enamine deaminase RidA (YjgF/YER057c/UK114 family)
MPEQRKTTVIQSAHGGTLELAELDGIFTTSAVPGSGPGGAKEQIESAFSDLARLLDSAGVGRSSAGLVTVAIAGQDLAELVAGPWTELFPDPDARPALKINVFPQPAGQHVALQAIGVRGERPVRIGEGTVHGLAPLAVRLGRLLFTSLVDGRVPGTGELPGDPEAQVRQAYANLAEILAAAGGSWDDALHVYVYFRDRKSDQPLMHRIWQEIFPAHGLCPARKAINYAPLAGTGTVLEFELIANLGAGERRDYVLDNVRGHDTGTMAASVGGLFYSSGISGDPPHGQGGLGDFTSQCNWAFAHLRALVERAGGTASGIGHVMIILRDYDDQAEALSVWRELFPDPADQPTHQFVGLELNSQRSELVQLHVIGRV